MIITGKKFSKPAMSRVINGDVVLSSGSDKPEKFRLDHLLVKSHPEFNRSSLQTFIKSGYVTVDTKIVKKPNTLIEASQKIKLTLPPELANNKLKQQKIDALRPATIYEDENILVVNKPAGLLSMTKGEYCAEPTLEDYGLLVHRLDRDTSGVVILAKNEPTQSFLRKQFQDRKAHKTYYAVVEGQPKLPEANIDLPIMRSLKRPTTFIVDPAGRPSQTYYRILKTIASDRTKKHVLSLVKLNPTTGRTHQLRVHLNYLGTPILGDRVYGPTPHSTSSTPNTNNSVTVDDIPAATTDINNRLFLHAASLEITIPNPDTPYTKDSPAEKQRIVFTVPLPTEFTDLFGTDFDASTGN